MGILLVGALLGGLVTLFVVRVGPLAPSGDTTSDWAPQVATPARVGKEREQFIRSYAMGDADWLGPFVDARATFKGEVDPILGWRMATAGGSGPLNVVDGRRVSYQPADPTVTVWWFGGSTMFGLVQRDDHTIPSEVARLAERDGIRIRSVNFGVESYNAVQEALAFGLALAGREATAPDLAVFYDGANELATAVERVEVGRTRPDGHLLPGGEQRGARSPWDIEADRLDESGRAKRADRRTRRSPVPPGRGTGT